VWEERLQRSAHEEHFVQIVRVLGVQAPRELGVERRQLPEVVELDHVLDALGGLKGQSSGLVGVRRQWGGGRTRQLRIA